MPDFDYWSFGSHNYLLLLSSSLFLLVVSNFIIGVVFVICCAFRFIFELLIELGFSSKLWILRFLVDTAPWFPRLLCTFISLILGFSFNWTLLRCPFFCFISGRVYGLLFILVSFWSDSGSKLILDNADSFLFSYRSLPEFFYISRIYGFVISLLLWLRFESLISPRVLSFFYFNDYNFCSCHWPLVRSFYFGSSQTCRRRPNIVILDCWLSVAPTDWWECFLYPSDLTDWSC